jgi:hypothetical protein
MTNKILLYSYNNLDILMQENNLRANDYNIPIIEQCNA